MAGLLVWSRTEPSPELLGSLQWDEPPARALRSTEPPPPREARGPLPIMALNKLLVSAARSFPEMQTGGLISRLPYFMSSQEWSSPVDLTGEFPWGMLSSCETCETSPGQASFTHSSSHWWSHWPQMFFCCHQPLSTVHHLFQVKRSLNAVDYGRERGRELCLQCIIY